MKILFLSSSLFLSSWCAATNITGINDYACLHLQISIKNETSNTCYLLTEDFTNDSLVTPNYDISYKILPNTESPIVDIYPLNFTNVASLELVYECGEGSYIRLNSQKNPCGNQNTVDTSILYSANLSATAQTSAASYWKNKPAKVIWTLK